MNTLVTTLDLYVRNSTETQQKREPGRKSVLVQYRKGKSFWE